MDWFTDGGVSIHKKDYSHIAIVNTEGFQYYEDFSEYYTNNQLEIMAILKCMREYAKEGDFIFSDSTLCVGGVEGTMKIKKPHLIPLFNEAKKLILEKKLYIEWIPREQNLAGHLLEEKMKKIQGARQ